MSDVLAAFALVFIAEVGDKTQLLALGLATRNRFTSVAAGVVAAYLITSTLSVALGAVGGHLLSTEAVGLIAGLLFLGLAVAGIISLRSIGKDGQDGPAPPAANSVRAFATVTIAMTAAELGDKTMFATAALAAQGRPVAVWLGALAGIVAAGLLGVGIGRLLGRRLPQRPLALAGIVLFAGFGVVLVMSALT
ncbi:MAG: TMEM165/GDT1 family protein [Actinomycetota bacterium]